VYLLNAQGEQILDKQTGAPLKTWAYVNVVADCKYDLKVTGMYGALDFVFFPDESEPMKQD